MAAKAHHVQKISLTPELLRYQAILMDGTIADEVTILPREERLQHRITAIEARAPSASVITVLLSVIIAFFVSKAIARVSASGSANAGTMMSATCRTTKATPP